MSKRPRGRRPKPTQLRLVEGTFRSDRHGNLADAEERLAVTGASFGDLVRPDHLTGAGLEAWERYIRPAWWLDASREACAIAFCDLWHRLRENPAKFPAALHTQLRCYMSELGLTDERNRFGVGRDKTGDEFFD